MVDAGGLAAFFKLQHGLKLVFLNGCSTELQVRGLLDAGVATVIATSWNVQDEVAAEFASWFYKSLGGGASIRRAFGEASAALNISQESKRRDFFRDEQPTGSSLPWDLRHREGAESIGRLEPGGGGGRPNLRLAAVAQTRLAREPLLGTPGSLHRRGSRSILRARLPNPKAVRVCGQSGGAPIILLYGQSGVGKSSLLDAGVLPRLVVGGYETRYRRRDPQTGLLETLRRGCTPQARIKLWEHSGGPRKSGVDDRWRWFSTRRSRR